MGLKEIQTVSEMSENTRIPVSGDRNHLRTGGDQHFPQVGGPISHQTDGSWMNEFIHSTAMYVPPLLHEGSSFTCSHLISKVICFMSCCQRRRPTITLGKDISAKNASIFLAIESSLVNSGASLSCLDVWRQGKLAIEQGKDWLSQGWVSSAHSCLLWLSLSSLTGIVFGTLP